MESNRDQEIKQLYTPEHALLCAVLVRAINDLINPSGEGLLSDCHRSARGFFASSQRTMANGKGISYLDCCDWLDLDPALVLKKILGHKRRLEGEAIRKPRTLAHGAPMYRVRKD